MPSAQQVVIIGEGGTEIGSKARSALAATDMYHGIFVLFITPRKELVLRLLPGKPQKLGVTGMAIRFAGESPETAAKRAMMTSKPLHHLGDQQYQLDDRPLYASVFYSVGDLPADNEQHIALSITALEEGLGSGEYILTPALTAVLGHYKNMLPV